MDEDIDTFVEDFKTQLKLTCKIHKVSPVEMKDFLWDITFNAAKVMAKVKAKKLRENKQLQESSNS